MHIRISSEGKAEALTLHTCPRKAKAAFFFSRSSSQSTLVARIPILRSGKALVSGGYAKAWPRRVPKSPSQGIHHFQTPKLLNKSLGPINSRFLTRLQSVRCLKMMSSQSQRSHTYSMHVLWIQCAFHSTFSSKIVMDLAQESVDYPPSLGKWRKVAILRVEKQQRSDAGIS